MIFFDNTLHLGQAVGGEGGSASIEFVQSLPVTGKKGTLYLVNTGETRDGYAIFQEFAWDYENSQWVAVGAFDIDINPQNLVYKTDKNVANGVAGLDANAQLNPSVIPYATASAVGGIKQSFDATTGTWTVTTDNI